jgi:DNA repair exonuclease SbcCD ATPase subunit
MTREDNDCFKLNGSLKKVNYIIHLADIHIKNDQSNKEEYSFVFNNLYDKIKNLKNLDETLIVICGDIFDNKTTLKADAINMLCDFFSNLCDITDCIIILGNHDQNINNENSADAITPILNTNFKTKYKNFVLKKSGLYEYANICFGVTDLFSNDVMKFNLKTEKIKINLYHGFINGATIDNANLNDVSGKFNQNDFSDGDLTLLGDIHKFQYLNKKKTIAYPSSLLQLNYGEDIYNHGFIYWNIKNKNQIKSEFIKVENDYAYITVLMNKNIITKEPENILRNNLRLRIIYKDTLASKRQEVVEKYKSKYNIIQVNEIHDMVGIDIDFSDNDKIKKIKNINNINTVNNLIMEFINSKENYEKEILEQTKKELETITKALNYNFNKNIKKIKLLKMTFNNMFIYGENNIINFKNLKKIVGLLSNNKTGKTSLIDIMFFSIWGESDRTLFNIDVLKNGTKNMSSVITLSINDIIYKIVRSSSITMKRLVNKIELYEFKDTDYIKINEDDKKKTEDKIRSLIGTLEDFTLLNCLTQDKPINFLNMVDSERKILLNKLFDLNIIKEINKEVNIHYRMIQHDLNSEEDKIKSLNEEKILISIKEQTKKKDLEEKQMRDFEYELKEINKLIGKTEHEISLLDLKTLNNINIDKFIENEKIKKMELSEIIKKEEEQEELINSEIYKLEKDEEKIKNKKNVLNKHKKWEIEKNKNLKVLDKEYQELTEKKILLQKILLSDNNKYTNNLENIIKNKELIQKLEKDIKPINKIKKSFDIDKYNNFLNDLDELKNLNTLLNQKINNNKNSLDKLKNHKFNKNCEDCMSNDITKQKIYLTEEKQQNELLLVENKKNQKDKENYLLKNQIEYEKYIENKKNIINNELIKVDIKKNNYTMEAMTEFNKKIDEIKNVNENNKKENDLFDIKIKKNREKYTNLLNSKDTSYDDYINIQLNITLLNKNITKLKYENNELKKNKTNIETEINKINEDIKLYKQNENLILNLKELNNKLKKLNNEYYTKNKEKETLMISINKCNDELIILSINIKVLQESKKKIEKLQEKKNIFEIIKNITDNGGIIEDILRTSILPAIEDVVNNILVDIETFKIKICYDTNNIRISKIENKNSCESSCLTASGHEKAILNVIFRIALSKLNNKIKTDFFIIDEAFKNSDESKKQKLSTLFEYIKNNYSWCLVITHDDFIKDNFDSQINIDHNNGTSMINFN